MTFEQVVLTILAIAVFFSGLVLVIVSNKLVREVRDRWRRARRRAIEPHVLAYAHGESESLIPALGGRLRRRDRGVVEETLLDFVQRVRGIERDRLGRALDELGYVSSWIEGLSSPRWWRRAECAEKLGLAVARKASDRLVGRLQDEVPEVRLRAAKALGAVGGKAAVAPLVAALDDASRWSTIRVGDILSGVGADVPKELAAAFPKLSPQARLAALDIVGRIRSLDSVPWLTARLSDDDADVRARAAHALGEIGDLAAGPALVKGLGDPAWPVRAMAAKACGKLRQEGAVPALCDALRDKEWWVRANAAEALRLLGGRGLDALERMLDDTDVFARHQAVLQLQESGRLDARVQDLGATDEGKRKAATDYLKKFVQAGQVGRLRALALEHPETEVREALRGMLPA